MYYRRRSDGLCVFFQCSVVYHYSCGQTYEEWLERMESKGLYAMHTYEGGYIFSQFKVVELAAMTEEGADFIEAYSDLVMQ